MLHLISIVYVKFGYGIHFIQLLYNIIIVCCIQFRSIILLRNVLIK